MLSVRMRVKGFKCESNMMDMSWGLTSSKHQNHQSHRSPRRSKGTSRKHIKKETWFQIMVPFMTYCCSIFLGKPRIILSVAPYSGERVLRGPSQQRVVVTMAVCFSADVQMPIAIIINGQFSCS